MNEINDITYKQMHHQQIHQVPHNPHNPKHPQYTQQTQQEQEYHEKRKSHLKKTRNPQNGSSQSLARDLNYCEVYYLSPSKQTNKENVGTPVPTPTATVTTQTLSRSSSQKKREKRSSSKFGENVFPLTAYRNQSESGLGSYADSNYDNFDVRSHYSDTIAATASCVSPSTSGGGIGISSSITTIPRFSSRTNQNVTFSNCAEERIHSNYRGSLKRNKGRSNQSLCSCDAEPETQIIPNPNRPLYQYSLDRKNKSHTYTCEQNAQILMRLERGRERQQKSALVALSSVDKQIKDVKDYFTDDNPLEGTNIYPPGSSNIENDSITDVDVIPPPPAPPAASLERKHSSSYSHHHQQQQQQQQGFIKGYTSAVLKPTEAMLNDCTATILNCANVGGSSTSGSATGTASSSISKPDLCNVNRNVKAKKPNQENIPLTPYTFIKDDTYIPYFKDKGEDSVFFYHQEPPQYIPNFDTQPHPGKYNTIGPTSYCAKQFLGYQQNNPQQCNFEHFNTNNLSSTGRYFSQSLSNFSLSEHQPQHHDGYHLLQQKHDLSRTTTPYTQFQSTATDLNCSPGDSALLGSSYTSLGSSTGNINFKGKIQHHHQEQQQQHLASHMPWRHRQCSSRGSSSSGTSSLRFDPSRHWLAVSSILLIVGAASVAVPLALRVAASAPFEERLQAATQLLEAVPLIDGHNDLPWNIRKFLHNKLNDFDFDADLKVVMPWARSHWSHTDLPRLKKGRVSAQFWAAYVPCEAQYRDAVQLILEQIDVIKRLTERYSPQLTTCTSSSDIVAAHKNHQLCSLTGVEGGHSIGGSLAVLRTLYTIGVRYMTLTSTCHTPWADSSIADAPKYDVKHGGLTVFGKTIIREMNRLGMIVDLSHVSANTMRDALATSEAPVIFSHSSAYELCNSSRNVQDDVLQLIAKNGGLVMVNFYSKFLSCSDNSTVHDAVAHINHIKRIAGIDHVGLGAGFDGINFTPVGLEDVSAYPTLFAELLGEGWSIEDLTKLAGQNFLRVMSDVERIRDEKKLAGVRPYEDHPNFRSEDPYNCTSS